MSGGPAYLRPLEEFTTRLCFVNFDGASALAESRRLGLDKPLPDEFVYNYCRPVYEGIKVSNTDNVFTSKLVFLQFMHEGLWPFSSPL